MLLDFNRRRHVGSYSRTGAPRRIARKVLLMRPKPVQNVETFDGRMHEVDMKLVGKAYTAWGFVDGAMIEGDQAKTALLALASWKREYKEHFEPAAK